MEAYTLFVENVFHRSICVIKAWISLLLALFSLCSMATAVYGCAMAGGLNMKCTTIALYSVDYGNVHFIIKWIIQINACIHTNID